MAGKSKIKFIEALGHYVATESLYNNQKEPTTFFFIIKAVKFLKECPRVCSVSSFLGVIPTPAKNVDLRDIAS